MNDHLHPIMRDALEPFTRPAPVTKSPWPFPASAHHINAHGIDQAIAKDNTAQTRAEVRETINRAPEAFL